VYLYEKYCCAEMFGEFTFFLKTIFSIIITSMVFFKEDSPTLLSSIKFIHYRIQEHPSQLFIRQIIQVKKEVSKSIIVKKDQI